MKTTRLLLPFTHGVEMQALEVALRFAQSHDAILVPVALIQQHARCVRPEYLQQAQDFLESVKYKAGKHEVRIERFEVITSDIVEEIVAFAAGKRCDGILLFARSGRGVLLQTHELQAMIGLASAPPRYLIHLPVKRQTSHTQRIVQRLLDWLERGHAIAEAASAYEGAVQPVLKVEQINGYTEQNCLF